MDKKDAMEIILLTEQVSFNNKYSRSSKLRFSASEHCVPDVPVPCGPDDVPCNPYAPPPPPTHVHCLEISEKYTDSPHTKGY